MKKFNINITAKQESYPIIIGSGLVRKISEIVNLEKYSSIFIITDFNVGDIYLKNLIASIRKKHKNIMVNSYVFSAGESNKNLQTVDKIYKQLGKVLFDRRGLIINLGGGVVSDLGGFVAATYMRGVETINISTSLLGMVDASVGGKVGVNFNFYKNMIGSFYHPKAVVIDIDTLKTLDKKDLLSGFAEIIKHGLIADKDYLQLVSQKNPLDYTDAEWEEIILGSCRIKAEIVMEDEKEDDVRKILNFGHTIGHALESLSLRAGNILSHGEAIAIGMLVEAKISNLLGLFSDSKLRVVQQVIQKTGLPTKIPTSIFSLEAILNEIKFDKKNEAGEMNWSLLTDIGQSKINVKISSNKKFIEKAIGEYK